MRLPRRVPWASTTELEQLCSWVFEDENDLDANVLAINRLSAWKNITSLPHALESTLALLVVITQEKLQQPRPSSTLALRQSYSTAVIRLVNGLVDPLQLGAYARSIASIANQLGIPSWLVELRHAATHEDLPSIELLREAARQSMVWLLHNYFLPTINSSPGAPSKKAHVRPLAPLLKQYKTLMKIITRDASLRTQYKPEIALVLKEIERWISETRVAANVAVGEVGWETNGPSEGGDVDQDPKERWTLERLCEGILEKGALVPLSKKKRTFPADTFIPSNFTVQLWSPLLHHLQVLHPDFASVLCSRIISTLLNGSLPYETSMDTGAEARHDPSYLMYLARWAMWAIETWNNDTSGVTDLRREVTINLLRALGHDVDNVTEGYKAATALLQSIAQDEKLDTVLALLRRMPNDVPMNNWEPSDINIMHERLDSLLSSAEENPPSSPPPASPAREKSGLSVSGWQILHEGTNWNPCPIGVYARG